MKTSLKTYQAKETCFSDLYTNHLNGNKGQFFEDWCALHWADQEAFLYWIMGKERQVNIMFTIIHYTINQ